VPPRGIYSLPFLVLVFVLVAAGSYVLADRSFDGVFSSALFNSPEGLFFLVVAPLSILALIGIILFGVISDSLHVEGPSPLRLRVFLSIFLLLLAVGIPESIIVGRFATSALGSWFDRSIPETMNVATEMADLYIEERINDVKEVAERYLTGLAIVTWRARPADWMTAMRSIDRHAVACQVYLERSAGGETDWAPVLESGDSSSFVPKERLDAVRNGLFELADGEPYLRWGVKVRYGNAYYLCAYATSIPDSFYSKLDSVAAAGARARVIDTLKPFFPWLGTWIFLMFLLPSLGLTLALAWRFSCGLSARVKSHAAALEALASGNAAARLVPGGRDELGEAAGHLNRLAAGLPAPPKPPKKNASPPPDEPSPPAGPKPGPSDPAPAKPGSSRATLKLK